MIIRRHRNFVDTWSPTWKPLAAIGYNTELTQHYTKGKCGEMRVCTRACTNIHVYCARVFVCGLRRLTIRDAGMCGRAVFMPIVQERRFRRER